MLILFGIRRYAWAQSLKHGVAYEQNIFLGGVEWGSLHGGNGFARNLIGGHHIGMLKLIVGCREQIGCEGRGVDAKRFLYAVFEKRQPGKQHKSHKKKRKKAKIRTFHSMEWV